MLTKAQAIKVFKALEKVYGPQYWWPAKTRFEIMIGAVLTQNTAWGNVEKAIKNLRTAKVLNPKAILQLKDKELAELLRPSGFFNIKAKRLKNFCTWYQESGGYKKLSHLPTNDLRHALLQINGVGKETADDILLYAFNRPIFVIDAYTRRIFSRLGLISGKEDYETLRHLFEKALPSDAALFSEYHALIVRHAKESCRKNPLCSTCTLKKMCITAKN